MFSSKTKERTSSSLMGYGSLMKKTNSSKTPLTSAEPEKDQLLKTAQQGADAVKAAMASANALAALDSVKAQLESVKVSQAGNYH